MATAPAGGDAPPTDSAMARGVTLVILAGVFWSTAGLVIRLIEEADGWQILFYRSAALVPTILLVIAVRNRGRIAPAFARAGWPALLGGALQAMAFCGMVFSVLNTTVANTMFVLAIAPVVTALLGLVFLGESVRRATWAAMAASVFGVAIMVYSELEGDGIVGILFAFLAMFGAAGFTVVLRWRKHVEMFPQTCYAGVIAMVIAALGAQTLAVSLHDLALCLFLGVFQVGLGLTLYTIGARVVPAAELMLLSLTEVVLAPIWVWVGVGETPSMESLIGGAIVLGAVTYQALGARRKRRMPLGAI